MSSTAPSKKLKLSFAMGGGVSLGAFSGSALTEALKLLLYEGLDDENRRYTHIELDSMSGASAGAVSLCIMLACLLNYKRYISDEIDMPDNKFNLDAIDADLTAQFGPDWQTKNNGSYTEPLRALQVAQKLQEKLWVEKVNMDELIRLEQFNPDEKDSVSLLDRSLLIELVNDFILADIEQIDEGESHIISKDRFLFACSLTNLIPLPLGSAENENDMTEPLVKELQKAHASYNHKELRIFDFQLNRDSQEEKSRLTKAITVGKHASFQYQIDQPEIWSMISATCLACAAFPFAFEPVVLKRFKYEYEIKEPDPADLEIPAAEAMRPETQRAYKQAYTMIYNEQVEKSVPWSKRQRNSQKEELVEDVISEDEEFFFFSYIDGGTLNNEPIREAFRMANYLDSRDPNPKSTYDRVVIFVDPIVRTEPVKHNSPSFYALQVKNKHDRLYVTKNGEWNRLKSYTSKLIGTLRDQGAIKEEHKISTYLSSIKLNKKLSTLIDSSPFPGAFTDDFTETIIEFIRFQLQNNNDEQISTFDIYDRQFIENVIRRYVEEQNMAHQFDGLYRNFYALVRNILIEQANDTKLNQLTAILNREVEDAFKTDIKKLFYHNILQAVLDADGKDPHAMRMAITPVRYDVEEADDIIEPETVELPGAEFEAFGGFANAKARAFSNEYGRYCAYQALSRGDFRKYFTRVMNNGMLPYNSRLIPKRSDRESAYRQALLTKSPLNSNDSADAYWNDIHKKIYGLIKSRLNKSIAPVLKTKTVLGALAILVIAIMLPWAIQPWLPFSAAIIQLILFGVLIFGGLYIVRSGQRSALKSTFYYHEFPTMRLAINLEKCDWNISHFRFNNGGHLMRTYPQNNEVFLPLPYFIGSVRLRGEITDANRLHFVIKSRIRKKFNHVFSLVEQDISKGDFLETIQLFHQGGLFKKRKQVVEISADTLDAIDRLSEAEKFISPILSCDLINGELVNFSLLDEVIPLEDRIMDMYEANSAGV